MCMCGHTLRVSTLSVCVCVHACMCVCSQASRSRATLPCDSSYYREMYPKCADRMANSEDPDQTALGAV